MAYSTSAPPALVVQRIGGGGQIWDYTSTDGAATVDTAGYFSNGADLGFQVGGVVYVTDSDASPVIRTAHQISSTTDVNDSTTVTQTDTD
jgi:hypothetical protein